MTKRRINRTIIASNGKYEYNRIIKSIISIKNKRKYLQNCYKHIYEMLLYFFIVEKLFFE